MILSPAEVETLAGFIPKLIGFVGAARPQEDPQGALAIFLSSHHVEIAIIEKLSDFLLPGSGSIEKLMVFVLERSHPMDAQEAAEWMRRQNSET